jgi:hypothetical protein
MRPMAEVMPEGVDWLHTAVAGFDPDSSSITTTDGHTIKYDYLVVVSERGRSQVDFMHCQLWLLRAATAVLSSLLNRVLDTHWDGPWPSNVRGHVPTLSLQHS